MSRLRFIQIFGLFTLLGFGITSVVHANARVFTLGATTSAYDSGLLPALRKVFLEDTGIDIKMVVKGTGRVLDIARRGDVDAILVHDRQSEEQFIHDGFSNQRLEIMYNDFVVVGPKSDPAEIRGQAISKALQRLAKAQHAFTSRGDNSGTHKAENRLWRSAGLDPESFTGRWYKSLGSGMGATLNTASALNAYSLTDRGTWLAFSNKSDLAILVEGDPPLRNVYAFMLVSPARHPKVAAKAADAFNTWISTLKAQKLIADFRVQGQQLFYPLLQSVD